MNKNWAEKNTKYLFLLPIMLFIVVMVIAPLIYVIYLSFTEWSMGTTAPVFVGLDNFKNLLMDERFLNSVWRTLYLAIVSVAIEVVLGLAIAMLLNRAFKAKNFVKTLFLLPMIATPIAIGMVWILIYEPTMGIANYFLKHMGIDPVMWLIDPNLVLNSLVIVEVWEWTPMIVLIMLAGLAGLPTDPYESAVVDGANKWQIFTKITLPLCAPTLIVAAMLRMIDALKSFDIIYSMTNGGPVFASETLNIYSYILTFQYFKMGQGSASILMFLVVIGVVCGLMVFLRNSVRRLTQ